MDITVKQLGVNRGVPRLWLEGKSLTRTGFKPATRYRISRTGDGLIIGVDPSGFRMVSQRVRKDTTTPIIDLESAEHLVVFEGLSQVKVVFCFGEIHAMPLASETRARRRLLRLLDRLTAGLPMTFGSLAHGGGVLDHALRAGFEQAGLSCSLTFANEIREDLSEHVLGQGDYTATPTHMITLPLQELAFDESVMVQLGEVDVVSAGLPCSGASVAGRAKRALVHPEAHPEVGHLIAAFLAVIARVNPVVILLENVTQYASSASMAILRTQLKDLGYVVHEIVLDGADFNALEHRKRLAMVAVTSGLQFSFDQLQYPDITVKNFGDILECLPDDDPRWNEMAGLKAKALRDANEGKSFAMQIFDSQSDHIGTLTKGLQKNRSTDPKIRHPRCPNLLRIPTPIEHARAKQIPTELVDGLCATTAHEVLGQSVIYSPFVALGKLVASSMLAMRQAKPAKAA